MIKKKFLLLGSGFLGRYLVKLSKKHNVYAPSSRKLIYHEKSLFKIKYKFDEIYHLAAWTQAGDFV